MPEGLPIRQITIIRIVTMSAGLLGALMILLEKDFFPLGPGHSMTLPTALIAMVGALCFLNLLRHLRTLRGLRRSNLLGGKGEKERR